MYINKVKQHTSKLYADITNARDAQIIECAPPWKGSEQEENKTIISFLNKRRMYKYIENGYG